MPFLDVENSVLVMNFVHVMIKIVVFSSGSHMLPSYYGMRRPFISDTEFCSSTKAFSADGYPSSLTGKSLSCDTGCVSGYSSLIDSFYPESFGDYRSTPFSSGGSTIFSPSALSSLLPSYSSDPSHYLLVRFGIWRWHSNKKCQWCWNVDKIHLSKSTRVGQHLFCLVIEIFSSSAIFKQWREYFFKVMSTLFSYGTMLIYESINYKFFRHFHPSTTSF